MNVLRQQLLKAKLKYLDKNIQSEPIELKSKRQAVQQFRQTLYKSAPNMYRCGRETKNMEMEERISRKGQEYQFGNDRREEVELSQSIQKVTLSPNIKTHQQKCKEEEGQTSKDNNTKSMNSGKMTSVDGQSHSHHDEHSIYKKYLKADQTIQWQNPTQPTSSQQPPQPPNSSFSTQQLSSVASPQTKSLDHDYLSPQQMHQSYKFYNPVIFLQEDIKWLISAMDQVENDVCGVYYLNEVYRMYREKGGRVEKEVVMGKIVRDLLFVIRNTNQKYQTSEVT